jgi:urea transport system ATP-binding protein
MLSSAPASADISPTVNVGAGLRTSFDVTDPSAGKKVEDFIGRALVIDPTLLILDEPTEGIQPNIVHEIGDVIIRLRSAGLTVLLVEHKLPFARRVASDVRIIDKGRLVVSSRIEELTDALVQRHLTV